MAATAIWATIERVKVLLTLAPGSRCKFFDVLIPLDSLLADKRPERPGVGGVGGWLNPVRNGAERGLRHRSQVVIDLGETSATAPNAVRKMKNEHGGRARGIFLYPPAPLPNPFLIHKQDGRCKHFLRRYLYVSL